MTKTVRVEGVEVGNPVASLDVWVAASEYPGRGLAIGRLVGGEAFALVWWTGRSESSRSRRVVDTGERLVVTGTLGHDDDPLRHYTAVHRAPGFVAVGNGSHVSQFAGCEALASRFSAVLEEQDVEPDSMRTARIIGVATLQPADRVRVTVGAARAAAEGDGETERVAATCADVAPGNAIAIQTYRGSAAQIRTDAEPTLCSVGAHADSGSLTEAVWGSLRPSLRVAIACLPIGSSSAPVLRHEAPR